MVGELSVLEEDTRRVRELGGFKVSPRRIRELGGLIETEGQPEAGVLKEDSNEEST